MVLHGNPANLDDAVAVIAYTEVHGVSRAVLRQVRAITRIAKIAALPKFVVGRHDTFMSRRGAVSGEAVSERQSPTVRPQLGIMPNGREKVRTGQESSQELKLRPL